MKPFVYALCIVSAILACGAAPQARIIGGDDAILGQIPYQAGLSIAGEPTCGAIILSERYVLTAMQCVCSYGTDKSWPPQLFSVAAGTTDLYQGGQRIRVAEIIVNPNYSDFNTGIALLKLTESLKLSDIVQPIELSSENPQVGAGVEISGWGRLKETDANMYRTLQLNDATVIDAAECESVLDKSDSQVICLAHSRKNGICNGDFGGPAVHQGKLVGVAAYVVGECGSFLPDVFTSVASNYDWIMEHMSE